MVFYFKGNIALTPTHSTKFPRSTYGCLPLCKNSLCRNATKIATFLFLRNTKPCYFSTMDFQNPILNYARNPFPFGMRSGFVRDFTNDWQLILRGQSVNN